MGQAVADLPDPLDSVLSPPSTASGTDDLLSQLAGDEIDRLLAEADADRAPLPPEPAAAAVNVSTQPADPAATPAVQPTTVEATPEPTASVAGASPPVVPAPAAPPAPEAGKSATEDELDALLNQLNQGVPPGATSAAAPAPAAAKTLTEQVPDVLAEFGGALAPPNDRIPAPVDPGAAPSAMDGVMSAAEREALSLSDLSAETDAAEREDAAGAAAAAKLAAADRPGRFGFAIRLLEVINAPAAAVPDAARDLLGKVAILTLVNAIAVLVYVLFIRR